MTRLILAILALLSGFTGSGAWARPVSEDEAYAIGVEAYTYAYPLVLMELTRRIGTAHEAPGQTHAPMNQFAHMRSYPDATFKDVVRPNADTLYSTLWYDVGKEPLVLTLPDTAGRYHVVPLMDMWTDVFATLGTSTTGNGGGSFAIVGPSWQGRLPQGLRMVRSPTELGWIIARVQTNGAADYANVMALQAGFAAIPLSRWNKVTSPVPAPAPSAAVKAARDTSVPPVMQVAGMAPEAFFALFADLLKHNPPHASDYAVLLRLERIGLKPGLPFDLSRTDQAVRRGLARAAGDALRRIVDRRKTVALTPNNWLKQSSSIGVYGNDYLQRAFIAFAGLGALPPEEAIYPMTRLDADGLPLDGRSDYVLHFAKDEIPPVDAFWSLTMYGEDQFFVANPINRFAIGDRDKLSCNADGSLDIFIQQASPGPLRESNWLPSPGGPFSMNLRLYLPRQSAREGMWQAPPVRRVPSQ